MEFLPHAGLVVQKARLGQAIEPLRVLVIDADVVGHGVAPCAHLRGDHREVEGALLPFERIAHLEFLRDVLEAIDGADDGAARIAQRLHVDAGHPACSIRVLHHGLGALDAFAVAHGARHGRLIRRDELTVEAFDAERAAEALCRIEQARGAAPELDRLAIDAQDQPIAIAGINADRQRIEDRLLDVEQRFQYRRLEKPLEFQSFGHRCTPTALNGKHCCLTEIAPSIQ